MKRVLILLALVAGVVLPSSAFAHPLGNFTVNTYLRAEASGGELYVRYVVDRAEIPSLREKDAVTAAGGLDGYARTQAETYLKQLSVQVDGKAVTLTPVQSQALRTPGAAGLDTLRVAVWYRATNPPQGGRVSVNDGNFAGRIGWHEALVRASAGARTADASATDDQSDELRAYPAGLLKNPLDVRDAAFTWSPGSGPAQIAGLGTAEQGVAHDGGFVSDLVDHDLTFGFVLLALLSAVAWGALHALSPGHGKSMIAAYLIGSRGTPRHAFLLGAFVTITHTLSVIALGLVTLWASALILPETLFSWINLLAALLVMGIGAWVVWLRVRPAIRRRRDARAHARAHQLGHDHAHHHDHGHDHGHGHGHGHGDHDHDHGPGGHSHEPPSDLSLKGLAAAGISAGLLPCPSAMVLMLGAISVGHAAYGLVLVGAFSLGLAGVLSGIGLLFLYARRFMERLPLGGRVAQALPVCSAIVIVALGIVLTTRALPGVI